MTLSPPEGDVETEPSSDGHPSRLDGFPRWQPPPAEEVPASLTIAVSREAGSRGATIARRVGRKLGWQVYEQELLDTIAHEGAFADGVLASLPAAAARWADDRLRLLLREGRLSDHPPVVGVARVVLALAAQGEVVILGRGAGFLLPPETTLHARVVGARQDRVAYFGQWQRLTTDEAAEQVKLRDARRDQFLQTHFRADPADVYNYGLLLNSSRLGEETCVDLIVQAARSKRAALTAC